MKPAVIFSILILYIGLLSLAQSHNIEKRSLKLLLGAKALLLKKKLGLLGLDALAGADGGSGGGGGYTGGYTGGYDNQIYGGVGGGLQFGGVLDKKLTLLGLKPHSYNGGYINGGYGNGGYVNGGYGVGGYVNGAYANGGYVNEYSHNYNHDYSNVPEKVVIVKVVHDGGVSNAGSHNSDYNGVYGGGYSGGYNGVYHTDSSGGYGKVYSSGLSDHNVFSGHVGYNHNHYPRC